ncbi:MAG: deoxyribose-phosphate aldolase [Candidatus Bipolaricaulota bacterium]
MKREDLAAAIDHTLLGPAATSEAVDRLCDEAVRLGAASVCVNPRHAVRARERIAGTSVRLCVVIGFPHGMTTPAVKAFEAREAIAAGAEELDMVLAVGALKDGDDEGVRADIAAVCDVAHAARPRATVKVILETCLLSDDEKRRAAVLAEHAGADFVKTSTGFAAGGATVEDVRLLRASVTPGVSVKAAGGIRDTATALAMLDAGASRIGASRTADILAGLDAGSARR